MLIIDHGEIVDFGTYEELIARGVDFKQFHIEQVCAPQQECCIAGMFLQSYCHEVFPPNTEFRFDYMLRVILML